MAETSAPVSGYKMAGLQCAMGRADRVCWVQILAADMQWKLSSADEMIDGELSSGASRTRKEQEIGAGSRKIGTDG